MGKFTGKSVVVVDKTLDLGFAAAKYFLREGANIALVGPDAQRLEEAKRVLGASVLTLRANIASDSDMITVSAWLRAAFNRIDLVFVTGGTSKADIDSNYGIVMSTTQNLQPILGDLGSIIFTSTTINEKDVASLSIYAATKVNGDSTHSISECNGGRSLPKDVTKQITAQMLSKVSISQPDRVAEAAKAVLVLACVHSSLTVQQKLDRSATIFQFSETSKTIRRETNQPWASLAAEPEAAPLAASA